MKSIRISVIKTGILIAVAAILLTFQSAAAYAADYTIAPKDTLYTVSRFFGTTVTTIKANNKLSSDRIYPGQVIDVPGKIYTAKSGDSLYLVAKKYGITLDALRKANNKWDNLVTVNQKLLIPPKNPNTVPYTKKTVIPYTWEEVDLLARLISAEARGESYSAMNAVGGVVVNRVKSVEWPDTISSVIYHVTGGYYQFTPVKNGEINKPATSGAVRAAWDALYGKDPSKGALFFFDNTSKNEWLRSKPVTAKIGSMIFAK